MSELITLSSERGSDLFCSSSNVPKALRLLQHFDVQSNLAFCGPTSIAMVLNAMQVPRPVSGQHGPHTLFTQENIFQIAKVLERNEVARSGIGLPQLGEAMRCFDVEVAVHFGSDLDVETTRARLSQSAKSAGSMCLINYHRPQLGQDGSGHISPLGAFNEQFDMVLVLDVSRYKYEPVWVPVSAIHRAMAVVDPSMGRSRGCVCLSTKSASVV
jgi:hypothetical protein